MFWQVGLVSVWSCCCSPALYSSVEAIRFSDAIDFDHYWMISYCPFSFISLRNSRREKTFFFYMNEWQCVHLQFCIPDNICLLYTYTKNDQTKIDPRWQQNSVLLGTLDLGCYLASTCTRGTRVVLRWRLICISVYIHISSRTCVLPRVYWINDVHSPAAAVWS